MTRVGDTLWFRPTGRPGPLAALVTRVNADATVNVLVLDDGTGSTTDSMAARPERDVTVRLAYADACGGECAPRDGDA